MYLAVLLRFGIDLVGPSCPAQGRGLLLLLGAPASHWAATCRGCPPGDNPAALGLRTCPGPDGPSLRPPEGRRCSAAPTIQCSQQTRSTAASSEIGRWGAPVTVGSMPQPRPCHQVSPGAVRLSDGDPQRPDRSKEARQHRSASSTGPRRSTSALCHG
ncbi:hypothetical protein NDU88_008870 [Pleurodeles waltl]|uniref:Uncharacterized protein n=1 Tax=Pleurodeles waltl TaxID=8319 RepID=A0AAV7RX05_PLEWA|nr:hypothetical protein NDU88_008870 [Pleurodeles waltl]